ncbi:hypothetical protein TRIATDRAFT_282199, partial [Trichoderma atroviride IMI 206040]
MVLCSFSFASFWSSRGKTCPNASWHQNLDMVMVPEASSTKPKTKLQFTGPLQAKLRPGLALPITVSAAIDPFFARHSALDPAAAATVTRSTAEPRLHKPPTATRFACLFSAEHGTCIMASYSTDPALYIYTSLTAGSSHIVTATSRLETILRANKVPFKAIDIATDDKARMLWGRRAGKDENGRARKFPALVQEGLVLGDIVEIEEWNEYGELKQHVKIYYDESTIPDIEHKYPEPVKKKKTVKKSAVAKAAAAAATEAKAAADAPAAAAAPPPPPGPVPEPKVGSMPRASVESVRSVADEAAAKAKELRLNALREKVHGKKTEEPKDETKEEKTEASEETKEPAEEPAKVEETKEPEAEKIVEPAKVEEPAVEEPTVEETKAEETKAEETKVEEPKVEEPKVEEPKVEEPKVEEPKVEEPKVEEPKVEETKVEETKVQEVPAKVEETKAEKTSEPEVEKKEEAEKEIEQAKEEAPSKDEAEVKEDKTEKPEVEEKKAEEKVDEEKTKE